MVECRMIWWNFKEIYMNERMQDIMQSSAWYEIPSLVISIFRTMTLSQGNPVCIFMLDRTVMGDEKLCQVGAGYSYVRKYPTWIGVFMPAEDKHA